MTSIASDRDSLPSKRVAKLEAVRKHRSLPTTDEYLELVARFNADPLPQITVNASSNNVARQWQQSGTYTPTRNGLDAPVLVEIRTNVIVSILCISSLQTLDSPCFVQIKDEYMVTTDLTQHIAVQYGQQPASIMLSLQHSSCLAMGGNFASCYFLTISTASGKVVDQKAVAMRLQSLMADMLAVPANRGIVCFKPMAEGGEVAMNGQIWPQTSQRQSRPDLVRSSFSGSQSNNAAPSLDIPKKRYETPSGSSSDPTRYRSKSLGGRESDKMRAQLQAQMGSPVLPIPTIEVTNGDAKKPRPITTHGSLSGEGRLRTEEDKRNAQRRSEDLHRLGSRKLNKSTGALVSVPDLPSWPLQGMGEAVPVHVARSQTLSALEQGPSSRSEENLLMQASKSEKGFSERGSLKQRSMNRLSSASIMNKKSSRPMSAGLPSWLERAPSAASSKTPSAPEKVRVPGPLDYHPPTVSVIDQNGEALAPRPILVQPTLERPSSSGRDGSKARSWRRKSNAVEPLPQISEIMPVKTDSVMEDGDSVGREGVKKKKSLFGLSFGRASTRS